MTVAEERAIRAERRRVKREDRERRLAEFRERKRRREAAHSAQPGPAPRVMDEPSYAALRGAKFTHFCDKCRRWFRDESMGGTVCDYCR